MNGRLLLRELTLSEKHNNFNYNKFNQLGSGLQFFCRLSQQWWKEKLLRKELLAKLLKGFQSRSIWRKEKMKVRLYEKPLTMIAQTAKSIVLHRQSQDEFDIVLNLKLSWKMTPFGNELSGFCTMRIAGKVTMSFYL